MGNYCLIEGIIAAAVVKADNSKYFGSGFDRGSAHISLFRVPISFSKPLNATQTELS